MEKLRALLFLFGYFAYIIRLAFTRHKGIYLLILGSILSILVEFLSIYLISDPTFKDEVKIPFFPNSFSAQFIPIIFIGLLIIRFVSMGIFESLSIYYAKELQIFFTAGAHSKILHSNLKKIEKKEIGHYISFLGDESSNAAQVIISFVNLINNAILILVYFVLVFLNSINLFLFILLVLVILLVIFKQIFQYTFSLSKKQAELRRKFNSVYFDSLNGLRVVKAFSIENYMASEVHNFIQRYCTTTSIITTLGILGKYIPLVLVLVAYGVYYLYTWQYNVVLSVSMVLASLVVLLRLLLSIGTFTSIVSKILGELKGTILLIEFLNETDSSEKFKRLTKPVEKIQFNDVSFAYGNTQIFTNLNLSFERGKSYAIVRQTGSGKSTLLDLLMDFNTPASGQVLIDGINTQEIDEKSLANKILYIGQDAIIFNDTVRKNLEINTHYEEETIHKILSLSCLEETIASFENGLDYLLQYRGTNISGGQKQRINLARALLRNPDVLILDESVNALDEITRQKVVENIKKEFQDKILIFVTHDRDILNFVDEIIDLDSLKEKSV